MATSTDKSEVRGKITNAKPIPHIPLPFKEVIADVLKVKPPEKPSAIFRGWETTTLDFLRF